MWLWNILALGGIRLRDGKTRRQVRTQVDNQCKGRPEDLMASAGPPRVILPPQYKSMRILIVYSKGQLLLNHVEDHL